MNLRSTGIQECCFDGLMGGANLGLLLPPDLESWTREGLPARIGEYVSDIINSVI